MNRIILFFAVGILLLGFNESFGQKRKTPRKSKPTVISCGICNQKAIFLPKPEYPEAAKAVNVSGSVSVSILIDEKGNVIKAKVISGHPLLRASSVKAALKAKFEPFLLSGKPVRVNGTIVYNFSNDSPNQTEQIKEEKIVKSGIVNGAATYLPKPEYPQEAKDFCAGGKVEVEVLIGEDGNVVEAKAISGDELLRDVSVKAAKKAKFSRMINGVPVKKRGIVVYNFDSLAKCLNVGIVNKKALKIPKPKINADIKIKQEIIVKVGVVIDERGNVVFAKVLTAIHPLLRAAFENAARQATFQPTNDVGRIRIKAYIVYKLKLNGKVET